MTKPISIEFIAEVAQYLRETKKLEVSTDDIAEALIGVTNSSDDLERKLSRAMRDSSKDVGTLERAIKDLPKATDDAADKAARDFDRMGDKAGDAGKDMGGDFRQSLGESLSSGGTDLSEVISETLGEAVGSAPLPVAAIGVLALGIYAVFRAQAEKEKAELAELFDMTDLMTGAIEQVDLFNNALEEIGGGDKGKGAEKLAKMAEITGVSVGELAAVITGEVNPAVEATIAGLEQQNRVIADNARETNHISDEDKKRQQTNLEILDIHNKQAGQLETNAERAATWKAGLDGVVGTALDLNTAMEKIDANQDNVIDGTDKLAVKAADVDMDGMLSHTELVNAGLLDIITKAGLIPDPGMPNTKRDAQEIRTIVAGLDGKKVNVTMTLKSQQAGAVTQLIGSAHQTQNRAGGPP